MASREVLNKILHNIEENTQLKYLNLGGLGLNDADLEEIINCIKKKENIIGINLSKKSRKMPFDHSNGDISKWFEVGEENNHFTVQSIKRISALKYVKYLSLDENTICEEGILALSKMSNLEKLWVLGCNITAKGAGYFLLFPRLIFLHDAYNKYDLDAKLNKEINKHLDKNKTTINPSYKKAKEKSHFEDKIIGIIESDNSFALRNILSDIDVNTRLEYGYNLLLLAIDKKAIKCINLLLKSGARIEDHEREFTSLYTAAENGQLDLVRLLLRYGANITGEFYFNNETALSISAFKFCSIFVNALKGLPFHKIILMSLPSYQGLANNWKSYTNSMESNPLVKGFLNTRNKIVKFWDELFNCDIPPWIAFGDEENNYKNYTKDCLYLYKVIQKGLDKLIDPKTIDDMKRYAQIYNLLIEKYNTLNEKPPSSNLDNESTDYEDDEETSYKIEPIMVVKKSEERISESKLIEWVNKLNKELEVKTEADVDWSKYPKFYIAQYRGIHYYRNQFSKKQRADHRFTTHLNRISPAPAVYYKSSLTPIKHQLARESEIKKEKEEVQDVFNNLLNSENCKSYWGNKKQVFDNPSDMLQQRMSNSYNGYRQDILTHRDSVTELLYNHKIIGYPHYATSDLPSHALKYAYGQKKIDGLTEWRLRPVFQKSGKPLHPYPGKVFICLFTPSEMYHFKVRHVAGMHNRKLIRLQGTVAPERETSVPGGVEAEIQFYEELLEFPNFESYENDYLEKYGIDQIKYQKYKKEILSSWIVNDEEEKTRIRKRVKNKIIQGSLISHKETELINVAYQEASRRGGYLIYRHFDGHYGIKPEGMRIPSKGDKFYTKQETKIFGNLAARLAKKQNGDELFEIETINKAKSVLEEKKSINSKNCSLINVSVQGNNCGLFALTLGVKEALKGSPALKVQTRLPAFFDSINEQSLQETTPDTVEIGKKLREEINQALLADNHHKEKRYQGVINCCREFLEETNSAADMQAWLKVIQEYKEALKKQWSQIQPEVKDIYTECKGYYHNYLKNNVIRLDVIEQLQQKLSTYISENPNIKELNELLDSGYLEEENLVLRLIKLRRLYRSAWLGVVSGTSLQRNIISDQIEHFFKNKILVALKIQLQIPNNEERNQYHKNILLFSLLEKTNFGKAGTVVDNSPPREEEVFSTMVALFVETDLSSHWEDIYKSYCEYIRNSNEMLSVDELGCLAGYWNIQLKIQFSSGQPYTTHQIAGSDLLQVTLSNPSETHWMVNIDDMRTTNGNGEKMAFTSVQKDIQKNMEQRQGASTPLLFSAALSSARTDSNTLLKKRQLSSGHTAYSLPIDDNNNQKVELSSSKKQKKNASEKNLEQPTQLFSFAQSSNENLQTKQSNKITSKRKHQSSTIETESKSTGLKK